MVNVPRVKLGGIVMPSALCLIITHILLLSILGNEREHESIGFDG